MRPHASYTGTRQGRREHSPKGMLPEGFTAGDPIPGTLPLSTSTQIMTLPRDDAPSAKKSCPCWSMPSVPSRWQRANPLEPPVQGHHVVASNFKEAPLTTYGIRSFSSLSCRPRPFVSTSGNDGRCPAAASTEQLGRPVFLA
ncbi:hypothetical protein CMUS01_09684 [Colletotrichum musicola]|uniref:Uncharacterized protein n=1 Tax=Colletotrichum musicola TaxID=2175873 RepID=A0A8H6K7D1_9PEZI|nr:hypothetical protein CMUS01_09684 [Colletotrichum musicola]